jgi:hypothetical protein
MAHPQVVDGGDGSPEMLSSCKYVEEAVAKR